MKITGFTFECDKCNWKTTRKFSDYKLSKALMECKTFQEVSEYMNVKCRCEK